MLSGEKVRLSPFEWADALTYRDWINSQEIALLIDRALPVTEEEHRRWYEEMIASPQSVIFSVQALDQKAFTGSIWLYNIQLRHRTAEVRIVIGKPFWGRGIGREAIQLLKSYAFTSLQLHKLYAYILAHNRRAKQAFEWAGFQQEALLKEERYLNGYYLDLIRLVAFQSEKR